MIIYKTTNLINNKIYVGKDSNNYPKYLGGGKLLKLAITKYGKENFKKVILEKCITIDELNNREVYWIDKLNSTDKVIGYNILDGGDTSPMEGNTHTIDSKVKMSDNHVDVSGENNPFFGKTHSDESRVKISENHADVSGENNAMFGVSRYGDENPFFGKTHSDSSIEKIREKSKKKIVLQYSKDGEFIKEWESSMEVYRKLNINCRNCCRGLTKSACGFVWKYKPFEHFYGDKL